MLDIGWTELLVIAIVLIVVVGPKDLPPMLRAFGKMTSNLRKMAGDFRTQFDEALREADMDDVRQTISDAKSLNPANALRDAINPLRQMGQEIRDDLQKATAVPKPADSVTSADDPLLTGADEAADTATPQTATAPVQPAAAAAVAATAAPATSSVPAKPVASPETAASKPRASRSKKAEPAAAVPVTATTAPKPAVKSKAAPKTTAAKVAVGKAAAVKTAAPKASAAKTSAKKPAAATSETAAAAPKTPRAPKKAKAPKDEA